jgi:hypothetical protein
MKPNFPTMIPASGSLTIQISRSGKLPMEVASFGSGASPDAGSNGEYEPHEAYEKVDKSSYTYGNMEPENGYYDNGEGDTNYDAQVERVYVQDEPDNDYSSSEASENEGYDAVGDYWQEEDGSYEYGDEGEGGVYNEYYD